MSKYGGGPPKHVYLPHWNFLGGQMLTMDGSSQALTIPGGTQVIEIRAREEDVRFSQGPIANANSYGFVPKNGAEIIGPLITPDITAGWSVFGAVGGYAHVMYFKEQTP